MSHGKYESLGVTVSHMTHKESCALELKVLVLSHTGGKCQSTSEYVLITVLKVSSFLLQKESPETYKDPPYHL